jgi:hypothetical protein
MRSRRPCAVFLLLIAVTGCDQRGRFVPLIVPEEWPDKTVVQRVVSFDTMTGTYRPAVELTTDGKPRVRSLLQIGK